MLCGGPAFGYQRAAMPFRTLVLVLVSTLLAVGCGESTLDRMCSADSGPYTLYTLAQTRCTASPHPLFSAGPYQEQNCRATLGPLLDSGTVTIASDDVISKCTQALEANTCRPELFKDWYAATQICLDLLVGHTVTGAGCSVDDECGGASYCSRSGTCGNCLGQFGGGAACTGNNMCQSALCLQNQCRPVNVPSGGQCITTAQCGEGLICRDAGHCEPLDGHIGKACAGDGDCSNYQASCVNQKCAALPASGVCSTWASADQTKPHCRWFDGQGCLAGACAALPVVGAGAACGIDVASCGADAWCTAGKCVVVVDEGGFCNADPECGPYALCTEHACTFSDFTNACTLPPP